MRGLELQRYIEENADNIDWCALSAVPEIINLPYEFIWKFRHEWDWGVICWNHKLNNSFIDYFSGCLSMFDVAMTQKLNSTLLKKYSKDFDWQDLSRVELQVFSISILKEFGEEMDWEYVLRKQNVPVKVLNKFIHKFTKDCWYWVAAKQKLTEKFVLEHQDKMDWYILFASQEFSKEFLTLQKEKVHGVKIVD